LLAGLARAAEAGFALPVVWNCGGYESLEALRLLDGVVDVYLPDAKYGRAEEGLRLSGCADYPRVLGECLREMHRQVGDLQIGQDGLAARGVLVRHLVLPADQAGPGELMPLLASVSASLWVNVLSQYRPVHEAARLPLLARRPRRDEVQRALQAARDAGLRNLMLDGQPAAIA
jgi:putative pyruvate formate lyase activating enzyme